jgi:mono/diheme cytochrome c family protein
LLAAIGKRLLASRALGWLLWFRLESNMVKTEGEVPMKMKALFLMGVAGALAIGGLIAVEITDPSNEACAAAAKMSFAEDVLPIFRGRCVGCHQTGGEGAEKSGLDLTSYAGLMNGTKFGKMVIPGDPESSNLMWLLDWRASPELRMPHGKKKLSTCDRDAIRAWIREGAKDN